MKDRGRLGEVLSAHLERVRQRPPEEQEAFKWLVFSALADGGWLQFKGTRDLEGRKLYLFQEPTSGEWLTAFRPDIAPGEEERLRQGMRVILRYLAVSAEDAEG